MSISLANLIASGDTLKITRHLAGVMNDKAREEALHQLKKRLLDASLGSEEEQLSWLRALFCESPFFVPDLSEDEVIRLFFLLADLYPEIKEYFQRDLLVTFLNDAELTLKHLTELIQPSPGQHNSLLHLRGITLSRLGDDLTSTTKRPLAREILTEALAIMKDLVARDPTNTGYLRTLSIVYENLGNLEVHLSYFLASCWFRDSSKIREKLLEMDPGNIDFIILMVDSYFKLGDLEATIEQNYDVDPGDLEDPSGQPIEIITCDECYLKGYLLCKKLIAMKLDDYRSQRDLSRAYERIGDRRLAKNPSKALRWFLKAHVIKKTELANDNSSISKINDLWRCCNRLGQAYHELKNEPQAIFWFCEGLELAERLTAIEKTNIDYKGVLAIACLSLAQELEKICPAKAHELYVRSYSTFQFLNGKKLFSRDYFIVFDAARKGIEKTKSACSEEDAGGH